MALCAAALLSACTSEQLRDTPDGTEPSVPQFETTAVRGGRMRLKFREGEEPEAVTTTRSGIRTGFAKLDRAAASLGVTRMQRVFPPARRFEERTRHEGLHRWYDVWFDSVTPVTRAASDFSQLPGIERVEPVYTTSYIGSSRTAVPAPVSRATDVPFDDPGLALQWHYDNDGTLTDAVAGADINLFRAWEVTSGAPEVVVAVVDGGIDFQHEDLVGNVGNWAELYGQEGVDDDGNGYVDDIYGWNFIYSSAYPYGSNKITPVEHGTHVAGTIGAENNNGKGGCGVAGGRGGHTGVRRISPRPERRRPRHGDTPSKVPACSRTYCREACCKRRTRPNSGRFSGKFHRGRPHLSMTRNSNTSFFCSQEQGPIRRLPFHNRPDNSYSPFRRCRRRRSRCLPSSGRPVRRFRPYRRI